MEGTGPDRGHVQHRLARGRHARARHNRWRLHPEVHHL